MDKDTKKMIAAINETTKGIDEKNIPSLSELFKRADRLGKKTYK
jgi:hypothetical protein